jgi:hypothetical protein
MVKDATSKAARNWLRVPFSHSFPRCTCLGGGVFRVGPGQLTDDSELMLALLHGLQGQDPSHPFPVEVRD